jgi:transposase-like protein
VSTGTGKIEIAVPRDRADLRRPSAKDRKAVAAALKDICRAWMRGPPIYLILNRSENEWVMPPGEWAMAKAQFAVIFGDRFVRAMAA